MTERPVQPAPQQAAGHRVAGGVEHAQQRVLQLTVETLVQFQMPASGRIHGDGLVAGFPLHGVHVRQALFLGFLQIAEQCAGSADGQCMRRGLFSQMSQPETICRATCTS